MSEVGNGSGDLGDPGHADTLLAAEVALRLLDGEALMAARAREARDPDFAALIAGWNAHLGGLLDDVAPVEPPAGLWGPIAASLALQSGGDVVALRSRLHFWKRAAAGLTALAASLALFLGYGAVNRTPPVAAAPAAQVLFASVAPEGASALAVVGYDRTGRSLIVTPATLTATAGRSSELWVIPADGRPRSLGLIAPGPARRIALADDLAGLFVGAPTIAISTEQAGGSRTGQPVGPVVATGMLQPV